MIEKRGRRARQILGEGSAGLPGASKLFSPGLLATRRAPMRGSAKPVVWGVLPRAERSPEIVLFNFGRATRPTFIPGRNWRGPQTPSG